MMCEVLNMLKIAIAQMKVIPGHPDENTANMLSMVEEAKKHQADIIIFPEMAVPGYLLGDTWEQTASIRPLDIKSINNFFRWRCSSSSSDRTLPRPRTVSRTGFGKAPFLWNFSSS